MWCSENLSAINIVIAVTVLTSQYIYLVQIFSIISAISSMANDGLVMDTLCMCCTCNISRTTLALA